MNKKFRRLRLHFRLSRRINHFALIGGELNNKFAYMTLTHSKKSGHKKNIKLEKNPNNNDSKDAYLVKSIFVDKKNNFSPIFNNLSLTKKDNQKIRLWFDNNKYFNK